MRIVLLGILFSVVCGLEAAQTLKNIAAWVNSLELSWKAETDLPDELTLFSVRRLLGARRLSGASLLPFKEDDEDVLAYSAEIPREFDARVQWPHCPSIRHVRDQGNCGSCWAVATASAFSDRLCIVTDGGFSDLLSEQELLTCCRKCGFGCEGGYPEVAWLFLNGNGIVTGGGYNSSQGCQPYSIKACEHHTKGQLPACKSYPEEKASKCQKKCTNPIYTKTFAEDHHRGQKGYRLKKNVEDIQREILTHGPVEATFTVFADFATYKSGVYNHVTGKSLGGHAVKMIGWGVENGVDYWLVSNSWNTHWGDGGFFKILRGSNECDIEEDVTAALPLL